MNWSSVLETDSLKAIAAAMSRFKQITPAPVITVSKKFEEDQQYWRGLQFPITIKEHGAVTDVAFQPREPYNFAVTSSTRVILYSQDTNDVVKTFSRFHDVARGASFRSDGKLLVAGNDDAQIRLFDVEGRVPLRIFKGHSRPVHVTKFCNNKKHIFSASDDKSVRIWDVATEQTLNQYEEHDDYIRCGCTVKSDENLIITGSYDHTVKMYDSRTDQCVLDVNHGCPVESVLVFPTASLLLSAGGSSIKVWDVFTGGRLLNTLSHHHKTITCMAFNHDYNRILSGGLDRHVKIYDVATYEVVHNIDYPGPILSLAVSKEDRTLAVGMADKMLSIRHRKQAEGETEKRESLRRQRRQAAYLREERFVPYSSDVVIKHRSKEHLAQYDQYFKRFQHSKALDAALSPRVHIKHPEITVAVIEELMRRDRLSAALAGRDEKKLMELMKFLCKNMTNISFKKVLYEVADMVCDLYVDTINDYSVDIHNMFRRMRGIIRNDMKLQQELEKLKGVLEMLAAGMTHLVDDDDVDDERTDDDDILFGKVNKATADS